jgi:hypothetical protein
MKKFSILLGLSAILISIMAGFFSITGIAMLFSGHFVPVVIMGASLEIAKLIIASFLYRYWDNVIKTIRYYLLLGLFVLMIITSGGIFGFLSDAYNKSTGTVKIIDKELMMMQNQKSSKESEIERYQNRISQLADIRNKEENRTDSLYSKGWTVSARVVQGNIKATTTDMEQYNRKIESLQKDIVALDSNIISKETQVLSSDVGPLRYMANVFNTDMDTVVKWFILLLIFVFDPIAVSLIVAFNITLFKDGKSTFGLINVQQKKPITNEDIERIVNESTLGGKKVPKEIISKMVENSGDIDNAKIDKNVESNLQTLTPIPPKSNWHQ